MSPRLCFCWNNPQKCKDQKGVKRKNNIQACIATLPISMIGTKIWGTPTCRGFGEQGKGGFISRIQGNKGQILREKGEQRQYCLFVPLFPLRGTREQVTPGSVLAQKANSVSLCEQRRFWRVCTFESRLSLRQWTKTSCAGSNDVF